MAMAATLGGARRCGAGNALNSREMPSWHRHCTCQHSNSRETPVNTRTATAFCAILLTAPALAAFSAPVTYGQGAASVTVEAFANVTTGLTNGDDELDTR